MIDHQAEATIFGANPVNHEFRVPQCPRISLHRAVIYVIEEVPEIYQHSIRIGYGESQEIGIKEIREIYHSPEFQAYDGSVY